MTSPREILLEQLYIDYHRYKELELRKEAPLDEMEQVLGAILVKVLFLDSVKVSRNT